MSAEHEHYGVLDGWRGISILLVLWGHWFPVGPRGSGMNEAVSLAGMALFFTLSGFLITTFLHRRPRVIEFLIRRVMRIVPLAWLFSFVSLLALDADAGMWLSHLFFYLNLPPYWITKPTGHLWSVCVEMHFYIGVALLVALAGRRGLYVLPALALAVTGLRVATGAHENIITWLRVDEILAGSTLALLHLHRASRWSWAGGVPVWLVALLALLLLASANPHTLALNYLRPYAAAALVGVTLFANTGTIVTWLQTRVLAYVAKVSYAIYVLHGGLAATWLGSGEGLVKYAKRPLLLAATFGLAHLSTVHFEARAIELGRTWSKRLAQRGAA